MPVNAPGLETMCYKCHIDCQATPAVARHCFLPSARQVTLHATDMCSRDERCEVEHMPAAYQTHPCVKKKQKTHRLCMTRAHPFPDMGVCSTLSRVKQNRVDKCRHRGFSWPSWQRSRLRFQGMQCNAKQREAWPGHTNDWPFPAQQ